ncbi:MAG: hypothetical protein KDB14_25210, partial [Planctomycetales bacterium]|nr:hypothetical protein [Planctomycetales bacterium]
RVPIPALWIEELDVSLEQLAYDAFDFDAKSYPDKLLYADCQLREDPKPQRNTFPSLARMVSDGNYRIGIFVGYDKDRWLTPNYRRVYHDVFNALRRLGLTAPGVRVFDDLKNVGANPLTRTVRRDAKRWVTIEVELHHHNWRTPEANEALVTRLMHQSDVFWYIGHGGLDGRLYLDKDRQVFVDELYRSSIYGRESAQQLFVIAACETVGNYADRLYDKTAKTRETLDVISGAGVLQKDSLQWTDELIPLKTVSRQVWQQTDGLIPERVTTSKTYLDALSYAEILEHNAFRASDRFVVEGDEDNRLIGHPFADFTRVGAQCRYDDDCGNPGGNRCLGHRCAAVTIGSCPPQTKLLGHSGLQLFCGAR